MYIPILFIFVFAMLLLFAIAWIMKSLSAFTPAPDPKPIHTSIGDNPDDFNPPSVWTQPVPAIIDSSTCQASGEDSNCLIFQFTSTDFLQPVMNMQQSEVCLHSTSETPCFGVGIIPSCLYPDQIETQYSFYKCVNPAMPNTGYTCKGIDGKNYSVDQNQCVWAPCPKGLDACKSSLGFLILNYDVTKVRSFDTGNPLINFSCVQLHYDGSASPAVISILADTCDIREGGFNPFLCNQQSIACESQLWVFTRYIIDSNGNLTQTPNGPILSIMDRNTGLYLAPVGFFPNTYTVFTEPKNLQLITDTASIGPGAWWYLVGKVDNLPCPGGGTTQCFGPPQIIFTSGWQFVQKTFASGKTINDVLLSSYSINVITGSTVGIKGYTIEVPNTEDLNEYILDYTLYVATVNQAVKN